MQLHPYGSLAGYHIRVIVGVHEPKFFGSKKWGWKNGAPKSGFRVPINTPHLFMQLHAYGPLAGYNIRVVVGVHQPEPLRVGDLLGRGGPSGGSNKKFMTFFFK